MLTWWVHSLAASRGFESGEMSEQWSLAAVSGWVSERVSLEWA